MISNRDRTAIHEISQIENQSQIRYGIRFLKNWILERIAASFPIPSVRVKLHRMRGINIGKEVYIGYDVIFDRIHPEYITIEDYAEIGDRCIISAHQRGTKTLMDKYPRTVKPVRLTGGLDGSRLHCHSGCGHRGEQCHRHGVCGALGHSCRDGGDGESSKTYEETGGG